MKTRPKELSGLSLAFIAIALSFPLQIMWMFGDAPWELESIITKLAPLNWLVIALSIAMVPLTLRASRALWIAAPAYVASVVWNNWLVASVQGSSGWFSWVHISSVALIGLFAAVLVKNPACRAALLHPKKRWWLTPPRKRVKLNARLCPVLGGEVASKTFDLSESGIFVALDEESEWRGPRFRSNKAPDSALRVGSYCWLRVALNEVSAFTCTAEIIRKTDARGIYPSGVGLRFVGLTAKEKKILSTFLKHAREEPLPLRPVAPSRDQNEPMAA